SHSGNRVRRIKAGHGVETKNEGTATGRSGRHTFARGERASSRSRLGTDHYRRRPGRARGLPLSRDRLFSSSLFCSFQRVRYLGSLAASSMSFSQNWASFPGGLGGAPLPPPGPPRPPPAGGFLSSPAAPAEGAVWVTLGRSRRSQICQVLLVMK